MSGASSIVVSDHNRSGHGTPGTWLKNALLTDWRMRVSVGLGTICGLPSTCPRTLFTWLKWLHYLRVDDTFETGRNGSLTRPAYRRSGCAARQTSALLVKDPLQIHFQRRACDLEDFAFELAKPFGFGDGVGAFDFGVQKPDLGNTFGNIIFAAFLNLGETFVADDVDAQERDSRPWFFQIELLAQRAQILALFPFFVRQGARLFEFMIGDGALHALDDEIDPLLNLRELFGVSHILALFVFFRLIACVNGEVGCSVRDA